MLTPESLRLHARWIEPAAAVMLIVLSVTISQGEDRSYLWLIDGMTCLGAAISYRLPRTGAAIVAVGLIAWLVLPGVWPSASGLAFVINVFAAVRQRLPWRIPLSVALSVPGYLVMVERSVSDPAERAAPAAMVLILLVLAWGGGELWARGAALLELERERAARDKAELRLALSRDLHDTVAQTLSRAAMGANILLADPGLSAAARTEVARIAEECRTSAHDLRSMLAALRNDGVPASPPGEPASADSLSQAVEDQADRLRAAGFAVQTEVKVGRLSAARALTLSAVTVEAGNNILKHARPGTPCRITVTEDGEEVVAGFENIPENAAPSRRGLGLVGVRERVALLNGTCRIEHHASAWSLVVRLPKDSAVPALLRPRLDSQS